jgi:hypothetical protein
MKSMAAKAYMCQLHSRNTDLRRMVTWC